MRKSEFTLPSSDGRTPLHCILWEPEGAARAVLQLVHGMCEYIDRYSEFAAFLADRGIAVVGHDHLGHGLSVTSEENLGYFAEKEGDKFLIEDIHAVTEEGKKRFPGLPNLLLGHSMGSFMVRRYLTEYGNEVKGAVIMGTGMVPGAVAGLGKAVAGIIGAFRGGHHRSTLVTNMAFGGYNKAFEPVRTPSDWLSRNRENVDRYEADKLCGFLWTVSAYVDFFTVLKALASKKTAEKMPKELPLLLISGEADPVGGKKAVLQLRKQYEEAGMKKLSVKLYPEDRHEILNELDREQVYEDIYQWISGVIG